MMLPAVPYPIGHTLARDAILRYKLDPIAGKGFSTFVAAPDNFRYLSEPVLSCRFRS